MKRTRAYLRSVQGQLLLFAIAFAGALVLACVPYFFRSGRFFEGALKEKYPELSGYAKDAVGILSDPKSEKEQIEEAKDELAKRERNTADPTKRFELVEAVYGAWVAELDAVKSEITLARRLAEARPVWVKERLKRTLVAGDEDQRARAVRFLAILLEQKAEDDVLELLRFARQRATRRGERKLAEQVDAVLR